MKTKLIQSIAAVGLLLGAFTIGATQTTTAIYNIAAPVELRNPTRIQPGRSIAAGATIAIAANDVTMTYSEASCIRGAFVNITFVSTGGAGFVRVDETASSSSPTTSNLNVTATGDIDSNFAVVSTFTIPRPGGGGYSPSFQLYSSVSGTVIVDLFGYVASC